MFIKPMLCGGTWEPKRSLQGVERHYAMQPKLDGVRAIAYVGPGGARLWTRNGNEITGQVPYIEDELYRLWPEGTTLDGELTYYTKVNGRLKADRGKVQTVLRSTGGYPAIQLTYSVFDVLRLDQATQVKEPFQHRDKAVTAHLAPRYLEQVGPVITVAANDANLEAILNLGFEGAVLKHLSGGYQPGHRNPYWIKVKPQETLDVVVTGFTDGKGKYAHEIGAVEFGLYDANGGFHDISRCSGMSEAVRRDMTIHSEKYIGEVMEINHLGKTKHGSVVNPTYVRMRDDKDARECVLEQL